MRRFGWRICAHLLHMALGLAWLVADYDSCLVAKYLNSLVNRLFPLEDLPFYSTRVRNYYPVLEVLTSDTVALAIPSP